MSARHKGLHILPLACNAFEAEEVPKTLRIVHQTGSTVLEPSREPESA
jgi:hypothetical protein